MLSKSFDGTVLYLHRGLRGDGNGHVRDGYDHVHDGDGNGGGDSVGGNFSVVCAGKGRGLWCGLWKG